MVNAPVLSARPSFWSTGLWMNGSSFGVLGSRLRREASNVRTFSYPTLHGDTATICRDLADFAAQAAGRPRVHFVAQPRGVLILIAPHRVRFTAVRPAMPCCSALRSTAALPRAACRGGRRCGRCSAHVIAELVEPVGRRWHGRNALVSSPARCAWASGQLFANFEEDNDGTVAVSETRIPASPTTSCCRTAHGHAAGRDVARQVTTLPADRPLQRRRQAVRQA